MNLAKKPYHWSRSPSSGSVGSPWCTRSQWTHCSRSIRDLLGPPCIWLSSRSFWFQGNTSPGHPPDTRWSRSSMRSARVIPFWWGHDLLTMFLKTNLDQWNHKSSKKNCGALDEVMRSKRTPGRTGWIPTIDEILQSIHIILVGSNF